MKKIDTLPTSTEREQDNLVSGGIGAQPASGQSVSAGSNDRGTRATRSKKNGATRRMPTAVSRRSFLGGATTIAVAASAGVLSLVSPEEAEAVEVGPPVSNPSVRASTLQAIRNAAAAEAAQDELTALSPPHATNGDEEAYALQHFDGNFAKTFPLDQDGRVAPADYQQLINAATAGTQAAFQNVPRATGANGRFTGPVDGMTFNIEGPDSPGLLTPVFPFSPPSLTPVVPPAIASAQAAAEMVELYWEAFLRDVPFIDFGTNLLIGEAVQDISRLSGFLGPPPSPQTIFRYQFQDSLNGPYVSQFLLRTHNLDGVTFTPTINTRAPVANPNTGEVLGTGFDYMTNLGEYVNAEQTIPYPGKVTLDGTARFVATIRDLGQLAASDSIFSIYFRAALMAGGFGIPTSPNNPFVTDPRSTGFGSFGLAHLLELVGKSEAAERHAFYYKWYVHRKLRPEAFGNLVDGTLGGLFGGQTRFSINPPLHPDVQNSTVLPHIFHRNEQLNMIRGFPAVGSLFLPQELATANISNDMIVAAGSPTHPASPAGHAISAGACVTILKAWFDTTVPWPAAAPVKQANQDGSALVDADRTGVTVLGEFDKLASNISEGRNMSGIHWRISDNLLGMLLGEQLAIEILTEAANTFSGINFIGWHLTKFDGTTILIDNHDFF